jgi:carbon-monoxide dehydrogenase small subunit
MVRTFPMKRLLDVLREDFNLTGSKEGCGEGECGACSVIINAKLENSCLVPILQVQGKKIRTIEGVAGKELHKVQKAFIKCGGAQCGICTPGMVMASINLLEKNKKPSEAEIRHWLSGNLCRCTGFIPIFDSIKEASKS